MGRERLYIIGNGFDLYHGIGSSYAAFGVYLEQVDRRLARTIDRYFPVDGAFWSNFEARLAEFDSDGATDDASMFLDDKGYGDFQFELQQIAEQLSDDLPSRFGDWIRSLAIPARAMVERPLRVDSTARFLSFNYTPTLERVHGVPRSQILHIHGSAADPDAKLILGHGWERSDEELLSHGTDGPDDDWRVRDGLSHLDEFLSATLKPTAEIIAREQDFFGDLAGVREVLIMGHGLHSVDAPYIDAVISGVDKGAARWTISVYGDLPERQAAFGAFGIDPRLVRYLPLSEM